MTDPTHSSKFEAWETPRDLYAALHDEFEFELDAAASDENHLCGRYYTEADDGLSRPWAPLRTWCNPPRAVKLGHRADPWVDKAIAESRRGALVVLLLRCSVEVEWFRRLWDAPAEIRFLRPRVRYWANGKPGNSPTFPSFLAILRPHLPPVPPAALIDYRVLIEEYEKR